MEAREVDVLVVGSGIAGLSFALDVAGPARVLILTKKARATSNTNYARGGIAAVMGADDNPTLHLRDTLLCGGGLCRREAVEILVREGPDRVRELYQRGVEFEGGGDGLNLGMEGGHSRRRIVHAGDRTGFAIESALLERAAEHPSIEILDDHFVEELLLAGPPGHEACAGARVIDERTGDRAHALARITLLASGGIGRIYRYTTNPSIATGDGIAMAFRAGAKVVNMEFVQFHPTTLFPSEDPAFLISEAVRGEGAVLRLQNGEPFMERHDPRGSLAPRDIVARAVHAELRARDEEHVLLDLKQVPLEVARERFGATIAGCRERGIDPFETGIPVVPAAHYACGGIGTDTRARTSLPGLLAVGEVACTGVHGANRLASNSLLEAVVFAGRAAEFAREELAREPDGTRASVRTPLPFGRAESDIPNAEGSALGERVRVGGLEPIRELMWAHAGIVRKRSELTFARREIEGVLTELVDDAEETEARAAVQAAELRNAALVALLVVRSALSREESRGLHYLLDYPFRDNEHALAETVVHRGGDDAG